MFGRLKKKLEEIKINQINAKIIEYAGQNKEKNKVLLKDQPKYTNILIDRAHFYKDMGQYSKAMALYEDALEIRGRVLGKNHPEYAESLNYIAILYYVMGRYSDAQPLYDETLKIRARVLGKNHPEYATSLINLAILYQVMGRYSDAQPLYEEALEIRGRVPGKGQADYARSLNCLASLYQDMGRYSEALHLFEEANEIEARVLGKNEPDYATSLNSLARLYQVMGRYSEAQPLFEETLEIRGRVLGKNHPDYAQSLNNLAYLYKDMGRYSEALPLYEEAKETEARVLGKNHPDYATMLNNLAILYYVMGMYSEALPLYQEAKKTRLGVLGKNHPYYANSLNCIAQLYQLMGRFLESFYLMKEAYYIDIKQISNVFSISSPKQRFDFLKTLNFSLDLFLSLSAGPLKENMEVQRFAAEVVLNWKGLELETSKAEKEIILAGEHPEYADQFQEIQLLRDQHVQLILASPQNNQTPQEYQRSINELNNKIESVESELAKNIPEINLKKRLEKVNNDIIAHNIPKGSVLLDFIRFDYYHKDKIQCPRYLAFILRSENPDKISMVDLGDADVIDKEIRVLRQEITSEGSNRGLNEDKVSLRSSNISDKMENLLLKPILDAVGDDCDTLLVSPDGDLSMLPFEVIPLNDGFLMDRYEINYLGTGRDLIRLNQESRECSSPMVMVDPDFNYNKEYVAAETSSGSLSYLSRDFNRDEMEFEPLPGTRLEGENISHILDSSDPQVLMETEAVETKLKKLKSPWILHLATHGFFLPDQEPVATDSDGKSGGLRFTGPGMENPLIRSGLAFAGANTHRDDLPEDAEDGIFTAEEASGLNLLNTELVVLSACETGLGEVKRGEGVFGLRRAFVLAGARTLVMSLWKVDDLATTILMERFYRNLIKKKMGRNRALKEAQRYLRNITIGELKETWLSEVTIERSPQQLGNTLRRLVKRPDENQPFKHPRFWGAFICQGDPRPLQRNII